MSVTINDVYQLGEHLLACGDALDPEIVKKLIGDRKISLILSDSPYGVEIVESKVGFTKIKKAKIIVNDHLQTDEEYRKFTSGWINLVKPYLTEKNSYYLFNSDRMLFAMREGLLDAGFKFSQLLIWVKNHAVLGRMNYLPMHELILYGWFGTHKFYKSQHKSVLFYPKPNKSPLHPTMKPVALLRDLILNSSKIGNYVYDPFLGSGSTLIACEQTRRKCLGIELDLEYCQTIIDRFEKFTGQKAIKL
jgi:site-specific DNA-methyltransferase (adenine-specific)